MRPVRGYSEENMMGSMSRMASVSRVEPPIDIHVPWFHVPYFPILSRQPKYNLSDLRCDFLAGVVAAVVAIPQGLAYALLAGLPPVVGLYTSAVPPIFYSVLGTSNVCSIGPNALVAMFLPELMTQWRHSSDPIYVAARSSLAAIIVGAVNLLIGLARLGGLVRFISGPVLMGFNNGAAVVIFVSQLPNVLGFTMPQFSYNFQQYTYLLTIIWSESHWESFLIGGGSIALLFALRFVGKAFPTSSVANAIATSNTLITAIAATVAARYMVLTGHELVVLGDVPRGLPGLAFPWKGFDDVAELGDVISRCIPVSFLAFMSLWSVARKYAEIQRQTDVEPNQEAFAIGVSNMCAGFFTCFPTAASFSRSALNAQTGARSPLSNLFVGIMVIVCLMFLTPLLYYLPMACLGGIICYAMMHMFDIKPAVRAYRVARSEFVVMVASFVFTTLVTIEVGLVLGIMASIGVLLQELSEIHSTEMVPVSLTLPDAHLHHDMVKVLRLTMNLFFGNCEALKNTFYHILPADDSRIRAVVIDAAGVSHADLSGLEALDDLHAAADKRNIRLIVIHSHGVFRDRLKAAGLFEKLEQARFQHIPTVEVVRRLLQEFASDGHRPKGWSGNDSDDEGTALVRRSNVTGSGGNGAKSAKYSTIV